MKHGFIFSDFVERIWKSGPVEVRRCDIGALMADVASFTLFGNTRGRPSRKRDLGPMGDFSGESRDCGVQITKRYVEGKSKGKMKDEGYEKAWEGKLELPKKKM